MTATVTVTARVAIAGAACDENRRDRDDRDAATDLHADGRPEFFVHEWRRRCAAHAIALASSA
jgi:hypothetical protein